MSCLESAGPFEAWCSGVALEEAVAGLVRTGDSGASMAQLAQEAGPAFVLQFQSFGFI